MPIEDSFGQLSVLCDSLKLVHLLPTVDSGYFVTYKENLYTLPVLRSALVVAQPRT